MIKNGFYEHYKGGIYEVIGMSKHTETNESLVVYKDISNNIWSRPETMWNEEIHLDNSIFTIPRFVPVMINVLNTDFGYVNFENGLSFVDKENATEFSKNLSTYEILDSRVENLDIINPRVELKHKTK